MQTSTLEESVIVELKRGTRFFTQEEAIQNLKDCWGDTYDYSQVVYIRASGLIKIGCKRHGWFWQVYDKHIHGSGCKKCGHLRRVQTQKSDLYEQICKSHLIHNFQYGYNNIIEDNIKNGDTKVPIECFIHGIFYQCFHDHLTGRGCPKCSGNYHYTSKEYIEQATKKWGNRYDYSKTIYLNASLKIIIICRIHGEFKINPAAHLSGKGCHCCAGNKRSNKQDFIKKAQLKYGKERYNYDEVVYINAHTKVKIWCNKCMCYFYQSPNAHLVGKGCRFCVRSRGEEFIERLLKEHNINFEKQKTFSDCKHINLLRFDFYIPFKNVLIEWDSELHFYAFERYGGEEGLKIREERDNIKNEYCENNKIVLIRLPYWLDKKEIEEILINDIHYGTK